MPMHQHEGGAAQQQARWQRDRLEDDGEEWAILQQQCGEPMPGAALSPEDLKTSKLYFEAQAANSDTCGLNALNNLCQRPQFKIADLQQAEAEHAQAQDGGHFSHGVPTQNMPTGFFDVEAVKIAARRSGLEIVDVEPMMDYRKSACLAFSDAALSSEDGSWFLGFLVYDRRPGFPMHYYALRRDERFPGVWLRLDSQLAVRGEPLKNRRLTTDDLWSCYQANAHHFGAWVLRWYPVVYCRGAAEEVIRQLAKKHAPDRIKDAPDGAYKVTEARALKVLKECGWVVSRTLTHLLEDLPRTTVRELLVRFARPSEAEMRSALEAADWDLAAAQPAIDRVLRQRIALAQSVDAGGAAPRALSLCDWEPRQAATLLSLQLQCSVGEKSGIEPTLALLHEALSMAGGDVDRAEALLSLVPVVGTMSQAATLLGQTKTWSVKAARQVLQVQQRFPRVSFAVALEVLRRNDDDPHAACEMLAEYQKGVQRLVLENAHEDLFKDDEILIAETALNTCDWDPGAAFVNAKNLTIAVQQTRKIIRNRGAAEAAKFFPVDGVLAALAAGEQRPQAAAAFLLGLPQPDEHERPPHGAATAQRHSPPPKAGGETGYGVAPQRVDKRGQVPRNEQEEEYCSVM